jgi:hypothetical protein
MTSYSVCFTIQQEALGQGLQQVLWLYGEDHLITEVGTMNIFMFCINDNGGNIFSLYDRIFLYLCISVVIYFEQENFNIVA